MPPTSFTNFSEASKRIQTTASAALIVVNGATGQLSFKVPFPVSSGTVNGFRCKDPRHNVVQVVAYVESRDLENCKGKQFTTDNEIWLLRVSPDGEPEWKTFVHLQADADSMLRAQPRRHRPCANGPRGQNTTTAIVGFA